METRKRYVLDATFVQRIYVVIPMCVDAMPVGEKMYFNIVFDVCISCVSYNLLRHCTFKIFRHWEAVLKATPNDTRSIDKFDKFHNYYYFFFPSNWPYAVSSFKV